MNRQLINESTSRSSIHVQHSIGELDIDVKAFKLFLRYIYTGRMNIDIRNVCHVYELAVLFEKRALAAHLASFIDTHLDDLSRREPLVKQLSRKGLADVLVRLLARHRTIT